MSDPNARHEEERRKNDRLYRVLVENGLGLICIHDLAGTVLSVNPAAARLLGYRPSELVGATLADAVPHTRRPQVEAYLGRIAEKGWDEGLFFVTTRAGEPRVLRYRNTLFQEPGAPAYVLGHALDVTDQRRAEAALRASESRLRSVVDNMRTGLLLIDETFRIEEANPWAERMFGYESGGMVGIRFDVLLPEPSGAGIGSLTAIPTARRKGRSRFHELDARRRDGTPFPVEMSIYEVATPGGGRRLAAQIQDISERREVERLKNEFISTVSHELRTPLTSIRGSLALLSHGTLGPLSNEAAEILALAERNAVRLIGLLNDILDLDRLESGALTPSRENVQVSEVLARAADAVRAQADLVGIRFEIPGTPAVVRGDPDRLAQVVVNLLANAVKFSPPGTAVRVEVEELRADLEVRVVDQGRGIPLAYLDAVFDRFRQVDASDAREKGGSGLGLSIAKTIVEQHGGAIGVESEPGRGSVFWFRLPKALPAKTPEPAEA